MNSIDALISACILFAGFGILIGAINSQSENSKNAALSAKAKSAALNCAAIIDSIASNSAIEYSKLLNCESEGNRLSANENGIIKSAAAIIETENKDKLLLKINQHYLE
jgi:hypothetical protein